MSAWQSTFFLAIAADKREDDMLIYVLLILLDLPFGDWSYIGDGDAQVSGALNALSGPAVSSGTR